MPGVAYGTNSNGSVIVGRTGTAFVWRLLTNQVQLLSDLLLTAGANLTGWTLTQANAVSQDGKTIVGNGTYNGATVGWIIRLP